MGEAKHRRDQLRASMIEKTRGWMQPATQCEADLAESIRALPVQLIPRLDARQIAEMRMPSNECHANTSWYARNDPTGKTSQVTGWSKQWPDFTLHSVLSQDGHLMCITPNPVMESQLAFSPDSRIIWVADAEHYSPTIDGIEVPTNVRMFPEFTRARCQYVLDQLESVLNPYDAMEMPPDIHSEMIRMYVPEEFWPKKVAA